MIDLDSFWQRLLKKRSAQLGLGLIVFLFLFCFVGPFLWRVDPMAINTDSPLLPPSLTRQALLLTELIDIEQLTNSEQSETLAQLSLIGQANTEQVVLGIYLAAHQHIALYRHLLPPSSERDLGLPLVQFTAEQDGNWFYADQLLLQAQTYYYSARIAPVMGEPQYARLAVDVRQASLTATASDAQTVQLSAHPFGTDKLGRDLLARVMAGGQISLLIALTAPLIYVGLGALYGAIAGYLSNTADSVMMAIADFIIALPFLLFVILLRVVFGLDSGSGIGAIVFALAILAWPEAARVVRAQALQLRQQAFVHAAKLQGQSNFYIVTRHILPNTLPSVLVVLSFAIPSAIFTEAFLSFLGLGILPPAASWGSLCNDGVANFLSAPHVLLFPALFISLAVLGFNLLGDGMRDALAQDVDE